MNRLIAAIATLLFPWGSAYLLHLYAAADWSSQWYGVPLFITVGVVGALVVFWFSSVMATNRLDGSIRKAVEAEMAARERS